MLIEPKTPQALRAMLPEPGSDARDWAEIQADFPALSQEVQGQRLAYLDSAASAQVPQPVLDAFVSYYVRDHANVHRGVHTRSQRATDAYERARELVAGFLGASSARECIFVRGATEGMNLVASTWGRQNLSPGDEVLVTGMEHHANIVPWQMLGAKLRVIPVTDAGELDLSGLSDLFTPRTKLVSVVHVSNSLGTVNPVEHLISEAKKRGIPVLLDGCQAVPHMSVDVDALGCDFYTFSGHKLYAPTGIGVLWGRMDLLESMPPWQGGGDMIDTVTWEKTTFDDVPNKFEAGTPSIASAVALGRAIEYVTAIGLDRIERRDQELLELATHRLVEEIPGARIFGEASKKSAVLSFDIEGIHPHDIGTILDAQGVAVRTGQHCTEPLMDRLGVTGTARASFAFYNDERDVDQFIEGLKFVRELFA